MKDGSFNLPSPADALDLKVHGWLPEGEPRAVLQILHGMAEHGERYARMAKGFVEAGWAVYAQDHRGHGESVGVGVPRGHVADEDGWSKLVQDARAVGLAIRDKHVEMPFVLMGHSMGSFIAQQILEDYPQHADAAVLSGSNGKPNLLASAGRYVARGERLRIGVRGHSGLIQSLTFEDFNKAFAPNRTGSDWLSRDPDEVDKYEADPFCGHPCSVETWIQLMDALPKIADPVRMKRVPRELPIYLFAGSEDPVGDKGAGVYRLFDAYRACGVEDVTIRLYPGGRHEMLNETNREEVEDELRRFCERVLAG